MSTNPNLERGSPADGFHLPTKHNLRLKTRYTSASDLNFSGETPTHAPSALLHATTNPKFAFRYQPLKYKERFPFRYKSPTHKEKVRFRCQSGNDNDGEAPTFTLPPNHKFKNPITTPTFDPMSIQVAVPVTSGSPQYKN